MKQLLLIITLILCGMMVEAQTHNVSNNQTRKQTATTQKKQSTNSSKSRKSSAATYTPEVKTYYANGVAFQMVEVRGGTFTMGATSEQGSDAKSDEKPAHKVTLSDYYIGKTEVTQALWKAVMGKTVSQIASENNWDKYGVGDNYPMYYISWNDCKAFISKLNALTGKTFRMPTEEEWEYAALEAVRAAAISIAAVAILTKWLGIRTIRKRRHMK